MKTAGQSQKNRGEPRAMGRAHMEAEGQCAYDHYGSYNGIKCLFTRLDRFLCRQNGVDPKNGQGKAIPATTHLCRKKANKVADGSTSCIWRGPVISHSLPC